MSNTTNNLVFPLGVFAWILAGLVALDLVVTHVGLQAGFTEANPITRAFIETLGYGLLTVFKLTLVFVVIGTVRAVDWDTGVSRSIAATAVLIVIALYGAAVITGIAALAGLL